MAPTPAVLQIISVPTLLAPRPSGHLVRPIPILGNETFVQTVSNSMNLAYLRPIASLHHKYVKSRFFKCFVQVELIRLTSGTSELDGLLSAILAAPRVRVLAVVDSFIDFSPIKRAYSLHSTPCDTPCVRPSAVMRHTFGASSHVS